MTTVVERVTFKDTLAQSAIMAHRGLLKFRHSPQHLYDVVILPVVACLLFANIFGGAISGSVTGYLPILIPGVLVQIVVTASVVTGVQLCEDINKGVFDRFTALPIARIAPLAGALLASIVRYVVAAAVTIAVGYAMGYRPGNVLGLFVGCLLVVVAAFALSWIFALIGVLVTKPSAVQGVSMLVLTPLTFASNALVPVETMPGWMRAIADVNPVSHLVSAVRALAQGSYGSEIGTTLLGLAVVLAVFVPATVRVYMRRA